MIWLRASKLPIKAPMAEPLENGHFGRILDEHRDQVGHQCRQQARVDQAGLDVRENAGDDGLDAALHFELLLLAELLVELVEKSDEWTVEKIPVEALFEEQALVHEHGQFFRNVVRFQQSLLVLAHGGQHMLRKAQKLAL